MPAGGILKLPITVEKAEQLVYYYIELKYRALQGEALKIGHSITLKARELGIGITTAWRIIGYARRVGMIEADRYSWS